MPSAEVASEAVETLGWVGCPLLAVLWGRAWAPGAAGETRGWGPEDCPLRGQWDTDSGIELVGSKRLPGEIKAGKDGGGWGGVVERLKKRMKRWSAAARPHQRV